MRMNLERSRNKSAEGAPSSWDGLKEVPFRGDREDYQRRAMADAKELKRILDSLPEDVDPEILAAAEKIDQKTQADAAAEAGKQAELDRLRMQIENSYNKPARGRNLEMGNRKSFEDPNINGRVVGEPNNSDPGNNANTPNDVQELFAKMDDVGSFGKGDRSASEAFGRADYSEEDLPSFEEHMQNMNRESAKNDTIKTCVNSVNDPEYALGYNHDPNVFRTKEGSAYRTTKLDQVVDILNCGYVRPPEGKTKKGRNGESENEVYWHKGGHKLNYPGDIGGGKLILETMPDAVKNNQVGAVSLDELAGIWINNPETGKRENKIDVLKELRKSKGEDEQLSEADILSAIE